MKIIKLQRNLAFSGSYDCSCRLWTLGGRYLGTLGTPLPWKNLSPFKPAEEYVKSGRMPPDIKKVASFTTIKVNVFNLTTPHTYTLTHR